jgi:hypothetical protein
MIGTGRTLERSPPAPRITRQTLASINSHTTDPQHQIQLLTGVPPTNRRRSDTLNTNLTVINSNEQIILQQQQRQTMNTDNLINNNNINAANNNLNNNNNNDNQQLAANGDARPDPIITASGNGANDQQNQQQPLQNQPPQNQPPQNQALQNQALQDQQQQQFQQQLEQQLQQRQQVLERQFLQQQQDQQQQLQVLQTQLAEAIERQRQNELQAENQQRELEIERANRERIQQQLTQMTNNNRPQQQSSSTNQIIPNSNANASHNLSTFGTNIHQQAPIQINQQPQTSFPLQSTSQINNSQANNRINNLNQQINTQSQPNNPTVRFNLPPTSIQLQSTPALSNSFSNFPYPDVSTIQAASSLQQLIQTQQQHLNNMQLQMEALIRSTQSQSQNILPQVNSLNASNHQPIIVMHPPDIIKLEPYDGTTDIFEFIKKFKDLAIVNQWNETYQASMIVSYLVGDARDTFNSMDITTKLNIYLILEQLKKAYAKNDAVYLTEFQTFKPKHDQTVRDFASKIKSLINRGAYMPDNVKEVHLKNKLILNLPSSLQPVFQVQEPKLTFAELISDVERVMFKFDLNNTETVNINKVSTNNNQNSQSRNSQQNGNFRQNNSPYNRHNRPNYQQSNNNNYSQNQKAENQQNANQNQHHQQHRHREHTNNNHGQYSNQNSSYQRRPAFTNSQNYSNNSNYTRAQSPKRNESPRKQVSFEDQQIK